MAIIIIVKRVISQNGEIDLDTVKNYNSLLIS